MDEYKVKEVFKAKDGSSEQFHVVKDEEKGIKRLEIWFTAPDDERDDMQVLYLSKEQMILIWRLILSSGAVDQDDV